MNSTTAFARIRVAKKHRGDHTVTILPAELLLSGESLKTL